ncbi:WD40 repeat-like protein [Teratosphaeria nubilosa]|uniref:WD40 repeat-like protein n=1 Tax=Teratosphaeria nubilosa TaxID=161662 RepID=A0A6G1L2I8_9PEZI|nr:WD40 repeat-like protein [Teratosphaeria nubilosa]
MAFQQQGVGNGPPGEHHGPQGTEYTLQGVMRFLQIEWHSHERARNAWDIERAEMKAKIAKQEGECRHAKRINEQLERQVRMLEMALKNERNKNKKKDANGELATQKAGDEGKDKKQAQENGGQVAGKEAEKALPQRPSSAHVPHNSFLETDEGRLLETEKEREQYLDNTTKYLRNCMKEIQYLLTPPQHPPPPQLLPNGNFTGLPEPPLSVEDIYVQHQRARGAGRGPQGQVLQQHMQQHGMPNHQPPPVPNNLPPATGPQHMQGRYTEFPPDLSQAPSADALQQNTQQQPQGPIYHDDQVESITHSYDALGRALPADTAEQSQPVRPLRQQPADTDGWTFDDEQPLPNEHPQEQSRRPDTDLFPSAASSSLPLAKSPPRGSALGVTSGSHRRKSSHGSQAMARRRSSQGKQDASAADAATASADANEFKVKFALRGHLDVVRSVVFSGGGSPSEPEVCTAGDDGTIKRWIIPASYQSFGQNLQPGQSQPELKFQNLDINAYFTHRGHDGIVTSLASCPASTNFSTGGRANGDGWVFSGGQDATVRVWERGRVDPKATLEGHTDAVWAVCVLPATVGTVFGAPRAAQFGGADRLILVSGAADGAVKVWAVSPPPQNSSRDTGSRRGVGGSRRHSVTSGSNFPSSPQPSVASSTPFSYTLIHTIKRPTPAEEGKSPAAPTSITALGPGGETFVVAYTDSSVLIFDTRTGEEVIGMASNETYDGTPATQINTVVATSFGLESGGPSRDPSHGMEAEEVGAGATGGREGVEGVVITGHEDRFVRFFDANSGQCTYNMLAHPSSISSLSLPPSGNPREAVSAGHDASIRIWSLEKRICTQEIMSNRHMRGEGVTCVSWSAEGRLVVAGGGDGVCKVYARGS